MNENPNNRSGIPQKQINRVVAPIQVDANGQKVEPPKDQAPKIVNTSIREVVNPNGAPKVEPEKPKKEHDQTNTVFVVVLLIILACVCGFTFYIIVPRYLEKRDRLRYNDATTTKYADVDTTTYNFKSVRINEGAKVTTTGNFPVDNNFQISTVANGSILAISINGKQVTSTKSLVPTIGLVDDLIIMLLNDGNNRQNRVAIYDKSGASVLEIRNIEGVEGMLPLGDSSSLVVNSNSFVILASRAVGTTLVMNSTYGEITGTNICDNDAISSQGVGDDYMVLGSFAIDYKGNHEFGKPTNITSVNLRDYKSSNRYCE